MLTRLLAASTGSASFVVTPWNGDFTHPLGAEWGELYTGSSYDVDTTVPDSIYMEGVVGSNLTYSTGVYKPVPAMPFTVTALIENITNPASNYSDIGIMLGEATPGKFIHGCLDVAFIGQFNLYGSYWPNPTTWSNNIGDGHLVSGPPPVSHFSRFVVHSQTNVDGYYSTDVGLDPDDAGVTWYHWLSAYNPGFTIGSVGFDLHGGGAGVSYSARWRFT